MRQRSVLIASAVGIVAACPTKVRRFAASSHENLRERSVLRSFDLSITARFARGVGILGLGKYASVAAISAAVRPANISTLHAPRR